MSKVLVAFILAWFCTTLLIADELEIGSLVGPSTPDAELIDDSGRRFAAADFSWPLSIVKLNEEYVLLETDPPVAISRDEVFPLQNAAQHYHETIAKLSEDKSAEWRKLRGDCWWYAGLVQEAAADYLKASEFRNDNERIALNAAQACWQAERHHDVVAVCDRAIRQKPAIARLHFWRGRALSCLRDTPGALAAFDEAIRLDPTHADSFACRGWVRSAQEDYPGAIADSRQAADLSQNSSDLMLACYAFVASGNRAGAIACTRDAIELYELQDSMLLIHLGLLYESHQEQTLNVEFANYPRVQEYGYLFQSMRAALEGRTDEAVEAASTGILLRSTFFVCFLAVRGQLYLGLGNIENAMADANQAIEEGALQAGYHLRGKCRLAMGDIEPAIGDFRQAAEQEFNADVLFDLSEAFRRQRSYEEAHATLDRLSAKEPESIAANVARARVLLEEHRDKSAVSCCSTAIDQLRSKVIEEAHLLKFTLDERTVGVGFPQVDAGTLRAQHNRLQRQALALRGYAQARRGNYAAAMADAWKICTLPVVSK